MQVKYYFEFNLKTRLQLRKWLLKNSPYPISDVINQVYGFYIEPLTNDSFKLHGLIYILPKPKAK
jgi:hypothetical protein